MKRATLLLVTLFLLLVLALPAAAASVFPEIIPLPTAFRPEGITAGKGSTFFAGSLADGTILKGDLRTGSSDVLVAGQAGRLSVGMSYDARSNNLFVAGGPNGVARVYNADSGALLAEYPLAAGFINDVIVTREAAYFTNSFAAEYYRLPLGPGGALPGLAAVETIPLSGDWVQGANFNANGIEATANGKQLIIVNSSASALYRVGPTTGVAAQIDLGGPLPNGDGLVLQGKTLYVVQNFINQIGVIELSPDLSSGTDGAPITSTSFDIPTTAVIFGKSLYAVNAKFTAADPSVTDYEIVKVSRR